MRGTIDRPLIFATFALLTLGLLMLLSASAVIATSRTGQPIFYLKRQIIYGVLPGLFLCLVASRVSLNFLKKVSWVFFILGICLLSLVFLPQFSMEVRGVERWIFLGPFSFQPAEFVKLALVVYLASLFEKKIKNGEINKFKKGFLNFLLVFLPFALLIFFQPSMGTLVIFCIISFTMFFVSGGNIFHSLLLPLLGIFIILAGSLIFPYQAQRILAFLNPQEGTLKEAYHLRQSLIAIGSGGIFGKGFGNSVQKYFYLPQPIGDTIFAIWSEETGLIGGLIVILLYLIIAWRGIAIAKRAPQEFESLVAIGITTWIFSQATIHIMATQGLLPFTGLPLPLISYGGSAMISTLVGIGLLMNVSKKIKNF